MQPPPQPPVQPPRRRNRLWLILAIIGGLLILACVTCGVIGVLAPKQPQTATTTPSPTATTQLKAAQPAATVTTIPTPTPSPTPSPQPSPTPTQKPMPTPASVPASGSPVLGANINAFLAKYGKPNDHSSAGDYHWLRGTNSNIDGLIVDTYPGTQQAGNITVAATSDPGWSLTGVSSRCLAFAPTDARFKQKIPYGDNTGYDEVYVSATLAQMFPASDFTDTNGQQVTPGTFDVSYLYGSDNQHIGDCDLIVGEQQTQG